MSMSDKVFRISAGNDQFRIFAVDATQTVQQARDLHDLSPISTIFLGRLLVAAALVGQDLKNARDSVTLNLTCTGDLQGGIAICDGGKYLRGYAQNPHLFYEEIPDNFDLPKAIGGGTITIIKDLGLRNPFIGICELVTGEIAKDLTHYYLQSEQLPTAIALGVMIGNDASIRAAGGFFVQQMPEADKHLADTIIDNISRTPNPTDLMDMGLSPLQIIQRFVLRDLDCTLLEESEIGYCCNCSRERFLRALLTLCQAELETMTDGIDPLCHYCNRSYHISGDEIKEMLTLM